jgi:hypothetical protein
MPQRGREALRHVAPQSVPPLRAPPPARRQVLRSPRGRQMPCACGGACPRCRGEPQVQSTLAIGKPGDPFEQEAERIAEHVIHAPTALAALDADNEAERENKLPRRATDHSHVESAPPIVHEVLRSPGAPLDVGTRAFMEARFGYDFGQVRVHTNAKAAESAQAVSALAYTVGNDVVFGAGQDATATTSGRKLLAHELIHVVQQSAPSRAAVGRLNAGGDGDVRQTRAATTAAISPAPVGSEIHHAGPEIHRQVDVKSRQFSVGTPGRRPGDPWTYREATEFSECIRIMGEEGAAYCRQTVLGEEAESTTPSVTGPFVIVLENVGIVPRAKIVEDTIGQAIEPSAQGAGRQLRLTRSPPGDLGLDFDPGGSERQPCALLILGNEGGGEIFVGAHRDLRVCSGPQGAPQDPEGIDHVSQFENVFDPQEPEFARFVGGTAVHELGHQIAQLPHITDRHNFMDSGAQRGANLPRHLRTRDLMRRHWSEQKSFSSGQIQQLQDAIRTGQFAGGMRVQPAIPTASRRKPKTPEKP